MNVQSHADAAGDDVADGDGRRKRAQVEDRPRRRCCPPWNPNVIDLPPPDLPRRHQHSMFLEATENSD